MNEAETRAGHIDPALRAAGWGGGRAKAGIAAYVLVYRYQTPLSESVSLSTPM